MLINNLLACFILLSYSGDTQCTTGEQDGQAQVEENKATSEDYIPTVIYFTTDDLASITETPKISTPEPAVTTQTFVIER